MPPTPRAVTLLGSPDCTGDPTFRGLNTTTCTLPQKRYHTPARGVVP